MDKLPSVNAHDFSTNPKVNLPRSTFDRSHGKKLTMNSGVLVPFFLDECYPGDTHNLKTTMFGRFATLINPIMDNVHIDVHYFAVPWRLLWSNFKKFMGEQENPGDSTDYTIPTTTVTATSESTYDYLGVPPGIVTGKQ